MKIEQRTEGNATVLSLSGEIDMNNSTEVREVLRQLVERKVQNIVVNMGGVSYIDSAGLATLVECLQGLKKYNGRLILTDLKENVKDVFSVARLDMVFEIRDSEKEALEQVAPS